MKREPEPQAHHEAYVDASAIAASADLSVITSSRDRCWDGIYVEEVWHRAADFGLPALPDHLFVFHLGRPLHVAEHVGGREGRLGEGSLTILPAEAPTRWQLEREGDVRHLHVFLRRQLIDTVAAQAGMYPDRIEILSAIGSRDPQFAQIGLALLAELHSDGLGGRIYAESLATLLAVQVLRTQSAPALPPPRRAARLSPAALGRAVEYVEESLGDDLSLAALAGAVGLSPYHFARLFRESTGLSPHQYVIRRRVERARLLLATTNRSLTAIAHDVGFASSSHLATHIRRVLGVSPRDLR